MNIQLSNAALIIAIVSATTNEEIVNNLKAQGVTFHESAMSAGLFTAYIPNNIQVTWMPKRPYFAFTCIIDGKDKGTLSTSHAITRLAGLAVEPGDAVEWCADQKAFTNHKVVENA